MNIKKLNEEIENVLNDTPKASKTNSTDYKTRLRDLKQYQKQYNSIIKRIETYEDKLEYVTEATREKYIDKLDWLHEQATELENIIYRYQRELRLY